MPLNQDQSRKDRAEAIQARRAAAGQLKDALALLNAAAKKLKYNKSNDNIFQLNQISADLKEQIETLEDPEYDPD